MWLLVRVTWQHLGLSMSTFTVTTCCGASSDLPLAPFDLFPPRAELLTPSLSPEQLCQCGPMALTPLRNGDDTAPALPGHCHLHGAQVYGTERGRLTNHRPGDPSPSGLLSQSGDAVHLSPQPEEASGVLRVGPPGAPWPMACFNPQPVLAQHQNVLQAPQPAPTGTPGTVCCELFSSGQRAMRGASPSLSSFPTRTNPSPRDPISPYPGPSVTLWSWFTLVALLLMGLENSMLSPSLNTTAPHGMDEWDLSPSFSAEESQALPFFADRSTIIIVELPVTISIIEHYVPETVLSTFPMFFHALFTALLSRHSCYPTLQMRKLRCGAAQ